MSSLSLWPVFVCVCTSMVNTSVIGENVKLCSYRPSDCTVASTLADSNAAARGNSIMINFDYTSAPQDFSLSIISGQWDISRHSVSKLN